MWGLPYCPSGPGICAIGFNYARYLAWISFLISVSSYEEKCEVPDDEEESAFLEEEELEPPTPIVDPLNLVLSDDILPEILKHLNADSLKSSRLVSRHWCQLATPILASRVAVRLYTVDKYWWVYDEDIHTTAFSFDLKKSRHINDFQNFLAWRDSKEEASDRRLVSYQHFKVTFASWHFWPLTIVPQNMKLFLMPQVQESLVSLTIQGRHLGWLRLALGKLPYLKSLKLEIDWFSNEKECFEDDPDFDYETNKNKLFNMEPGKFSDLPRLEELSVVQEEYFHDEPQWHWIFAASPRLSTLNLRLAAEPDMFSSLENLLSGYRGFGLRSLSCKFSKKQPLPASPDSPRLALVLHDILNSDKISGGLRLFSCNVILTPHQWAGVFRTAKTNRPLISPLETLSLYIFTSDSRAEFVNDFLLFCPTFAGEAYFKRLKSLSIRIKDRLVRKNASSDEKSGSSSSEPIQILKSSRILPHLESLTFFYISNVTPCQQLSQQFFQPFPNLKSLATNVDTRKCVTAIFRHMPLGLKELFLQSTNRMVQLKVEDFVVYLHKFESIEELILARMEMSEVSTDESLLDAFTKFRNLRNLKRLGFQNSLSTFYFRLDASSRRWNLLTGNELFTALTTMNRSI